MLFSYIALLLPLLASAAAAPASAQELSAGDIVVVDVDGAQMVFKVLDTEKKTVQIGSGRPAAIPVETAGELVIPSEVMLGDEPYSVVKIADSAFVACRMLTSVQVPPSIIGSGINAFLGCTGLRKVVVPSLESWCAITFSNMYSNPLYYACRLYSDPQTEITTLVLPATVKKIGSYAFMRSHIRTAVIPASVQELSNNSFYNCTYLDSLHFEEGVGRIKANAFYGCTALTSLTLPEGMTSIGSSAFYACTSLQSVTLPSTLVGASPYIGIGSYAFKGCTSLRSVTSRIQSPASVLGKDAFASIASDCVLLIPVGKLTEYVNAGWTWSIFKGGIVEVGEAVENLSVENAVTADFIASVAYPDDDYSFTRIADYTARVTSYRKDLPWPVRIGVPVGSAPEGHEATALMVLHTCADGQQVRCDTFMMGQKAVEIWNLIPQKDYTYQLYALAPADSMTLIADGGFHTEGQVRMMNIKNMSNFRDLGGWPLPHGRHVRYDRLFRSAELQQERQLISEDGLRELLVVQGIGVEIDFGDFSTDSPAQQSLEFVHGEDYQIKPYAGGIVSTAAQYRNCFQKVVESLQEGKKVLFHCSEGADRTGTFAFLLEGLLGVSESDLAKDYELTDFYMDKRSDEARKRYRNNWYKALVEHVKSSYTGSSFSEKIEQMALALGITQESIGLFRSLMTEGEYAAGADTLSAAHTEATAGQKAVVNIELTNEDVVRRCQFRLSLPGGVTVATKNNGKRDVRLTERAENYSVKSRLEEPCGYHFVVASVDDEDSFTSHSGALMEVTVEVADTMAAGDYEVRVADVELGLADGKENMAVVSVCETVATLTVTASNDGGEDPPAPAIIPGDADNDQSVTLADVDCVISYILGHTPGPAFSFEAADINADGVITVTDAGLILNLVLSQSTSSH